MSFCVILICPTCKGLPACRLAQSAQVGTVFVPLSEQLQQPIKLLAFIKNLPRMCIHFAYLCITLHQFVNHVICSIVGWFVSAFRPPQIESRSMLQHFVHQPLKFKIMLKAREQLTTSEWKCPENRQIFEKIDASKLKSNNHLHWAAVCSCENGWTVQESLLGRAKCTREYQEHRNTWRHD